MKKQLSIIALLFLLPFGFALSQNSKGHNIRIRIAGLKDTTCIFANYYGEKQYVRDTVKVDAQGWISIKGPAPIEGGIYMILLPDKSYFEFIITEQEFTLETQAGNLVMAMKEKNTEENKNFYKYLSFIEPRKKKVEAISPKIKPLEISNPDSAKILKDQLAALDKEVVEFKKTFMSQNPTAFVTSVFKASEPPVIPEGLDSNKKFFYYKEHFFDNINFKDGRLLRTPVFHQKLKEYFDNLVVKQQDSVIKDCNRVIELSRGDSEIFKYVVIYLINRYANDKVMCMDAPYVFIAKKVYLTGEAVWADSATLAKIKERVDKMEPCLCGQIAKNIAMKDSLMNVIPLHSVKSKYTLLVFWDYDCGHCKKELPLLRDKYDSLKAKGIEVYAVCTRLDPAPWKKFLKDNELPNWINVIDLENRTRFRDFYDIYSTPVIYILDENKKILGKRVDVYQVMPFIENYERQKK